MQFDQLKRREFITLLGGAAATWPLAARAQQPAIPTIGFLDVGSPDLADRVAEFRKGLNETGYIEGRNVAIEYRWAEGRRERLPGMAADLIGRKVVVIAAAPSSAASAAKAATTTVPIVFVSSFDPVSLGLVASLNRPGGNITGISVLAGELEAKLLQIARELVPNADLVGQLVNPKNLNAQNATKALRATAQAIGQQLIVVNASSENEIDVAFATLAGQRASALIVNADVVLSRQRAQIISLAARYAIPVIYPFPDFVMAGGLMSYGSDMAEGYHLSGGYTGRVLKGEKPGNLPVIQSTKIELIINLKTANAMGLTVPPSLLVRADKVIE
jgi:putative ABC transport system substrate-binding protein